MNSHADYVHELKALESVLPNIDDVKSKFVAANNLCHCNSPLLFISGILGSESFYNEMSSHHWKDISSLSLCSVLTFIVGSKDNNEYREMFISSAAHIFSILKSNGNQPCLKLLMSCFTRDAFELACFDERLDAAIREKITNTISFTHPHIPGEKINDRNGSNIDVYSMIVMNKLNYLDSSIKSFTDKLVGSIFTAEVYGSSISNETNKLLSALDSLDYCVKDSVYRSLIDSKINNKFYIHRVPVSYRAQCLSDQLGI